MEVGDILPVEDASELPDWRLPLSFMKGRHTDTIEGLPPGNDEWRVKERLKTWSVALALCMNIGVDPPDVVKTTPCARQECWIDPLSMSPQKAMEQIGNNLQKQYERWQPRARYKQLLDPTTDEVRKLCIALRKNAKNERVLFHYNGHGVPKPTPNGEIWVFNKSYTQYIPLSIYDLQVWMGKPSVYVVDCSHGGQVLESFKLFARERESEFLLQASTNITHTPINCFGLLEESILLVACGNKEVLPMNPKLPADLFTSCLTTPIKTALYWYCLQKVNKLIQGVTADMIEQIPGKLNDRKTPLGELNWVFTAITDTIAWNTLPQGLFQRLFRQDLLVASLFRNFLLAERIMRSYNCTPESHPFIPSTYQHPLWHAWDLTIDHIMSQLPKLINNTAEYEPSKFFPEQLNAFQVWLISSPDINQIPSQLPIILQFLLSQAHRLQALELLGRYLDMGPEAVHAALSVGIFPYVLKLLNSKLKELQPILVFIWAKILAVDNGCQSDLVKDGGYKYFVSVLADNTMQYEYRTMAAFIISTIVKDYPKGKEVCLQANVISICLSQLDEKNSVLKQWLAICLGRIWYKYDAARWCGVRDSAHEKVAQLLWDEIPEVRTAAVYALGTYILNTTESGQQSDHARSIERNVAIMLLPMVTDGTPLVRQELITALHGITLQYDREFQLAALRGSDNERMVASNLSTSLTTGGWINVFIDAPQDDETATSRPVGGVDNVLLSNGEGFISTFYGSSGESDATPPKGSIHGGGNSPIARYHDTLSTRSVYSQIWRAIQILSADPCPVVAQRAQNIIHVVLDKIRQTSRAKSISTSIVTSSLSVPTVTSVRQQTQSRTLGRSTRSNITEETISLRDPQQSLPPSSQIQPVIPWSSTQETASNNSITNSITTNNNNNIPQTEFCYWCCKYFANSLMRQPDDCDRFSESYLQREFRFLRNHTIRQGIKPLNDNLDKAKFNDQIFINKEVKTVQELMFHPYLPQLAVVHKTSWSIWDIEEGCRLCTYNNHNHSSKITASEFINPHDVSLLLTGTDDGNIKIWKDYNQDETMDIQPKLVTCWRALSDIQHGSRNIGMVLEWEQQSGLLYTTGDVRYIRVWDTHKELKIQDIITEADSCVTSIALDTHDRSLMVAGFGDGTVRLYDKRNPLSCSLIHTLREHTSWIQRVYVQQPVNNIISISSKGELRKWDPRFMKPVQGLATLPEINACVLHQSANLLACASHQAIKLFNLNTCESINSIRYHDGFMGQRIGPTKTLAFHPYKLWMAAGGTDGLISVYSSERKK